MNLPSFSIVIPTYQRRDLVCDAVRALTKVRYEGSLELIVVVDGSTDGTAEALAKIDCPFPFHVIEQANAGAAHARNRGAERAAGEILLFLDDDMIAEPDLVEQHARTHAEGADAVLGHIPLDEGSPPGFLADDVAMYADSMLGEFAPGPLMSSPASFRCAGRCSRRSAASTRASRPEQFSAMRMPISA